MKDGRKVFIWSVSVLVLCCFTGCLFMLGGASATELPGAVVKLLVPNGSTVKQTLEKVDNVLLERGYEKQPYDDRLSSQSYLKEQFEVSYDPYDPPQDTLGVVYIHFYETGGYYYFTEAGINEYSSLEREFKMVGFQSAQEDEADRKNSRWAATPEMFNDRKRSWPAVIPRFTGPLLALTGLLLFGVLVLWPGFWVVSKVTQYFVKKESLKRLLFVTGCSLFAPGLILLTPFGPPLLAPFPIALIFALAAPPLLILLGISVICTGIIAYIISLRIWPRQSLLDDRSSQGNM